MKEFFKELSATKHLLFSLVLLLVAYPTEGLVLSLMQLTYEQLLTLLDAAVLSPVCAWIMYNAIILVLVKMKKIAL